MPLPTRRVRRGRTLVATLCGVLFFSAAGHRLAAEEAAFSATPSALRVLEQRLPAGRTLAVPPPADGSRAVASDLQVEAALRALLADYLAPPGSFAAQAPELVQALGQIRPGQAPLWTRAACDVYLDAATDSAEEDILRAVSAAVIAAPLQAAATVRAAITSVTFATESRGRGRPPLAHRAAAPLMGRIVATAVQHLRDRADVSSRVFSIIGESLRLSRELGSSAILIETLAAATRGAKGIAPLSPAEIARFAYAEAAPTRDDAGLIAAAILRGAGTDATGAVREQAALTLSVPFAAFVTLVSNAFVSATEVPEAPGSGIARSITVRNADFIPALMIGASVCRPDAAVQILEAGLNRDIVLHGRAHVGDILLASLRAAPGFSVELAAAAVGRGDLSEGNAPTLIAEAIARGAPASRVDEALTAQIRAQPAEVDFARATVAGALSGSTIASRFAAQAAIVRTVVTTAGHSGAVLAQAIAAAPRRGQAISVLGVLAGDPAQAADFLAHTLANPALDPSQKAPLAAAGGLILDLQRAPALFVPATLARLAAAREAEPEVRQAIVQAAALMNPRGAHAIAASAAASDPETPAATWRLLAAQGNRAVAASFEPAVAAALAVGENEAAIGSWLRREIALAPAQAASFLAGAIVARPALADLSAGAAAQAAPSAAAAITRTSFAFAGSRHPEAPGDPSPAALTASILRGLLAAQLDPGAERAAVAEAAAAAVRSIFALVRDPIPGRELSLGPALGSVIDATARTAPAHIHALAQSIAFAARSLAGRSFQGDALRSAILAARPGLDPAPLGTAIAAGMEAADRYTPAATARELSDYSYDPLTGPPLTRYLDL